MDERAVRAAVDRISRESHGLYTDASGKYRLVPVAALQQLVDAVTPGTAQPPDVSTDRP